MTFNRTQGFKNTRFNGFKLNALWDKGYNAICEEVAKYPNHAESVAQ
jgi:hypothetical protein